MWGWGEDGTQHPEGDTPWSMLTGKASSPSSALRQRLGGPEAPWQLHQAMGSLRRGRSGSWLQGLGHASQIPRPTNHREKGETAQEGELGAAQCSAAAGLWPLAPGQNSTEPQLGLQGRHQWETGSLGEGGSPTRADLSTSTALRPATANQRQT